MQQFYVFIHRFSVYQDIIEIYYDPTVQKIEKDGINHPLKCCRGCRQPKRHNQKLKCAVTARETRFYSIWGVHWHLVVSVPHVYFAKNPGAIKAL